MPNYFSFWTKNGVPEKQRGGFCSGYTSIFFKVTFLLWHSAELFYAYAHFVAQNIKRKWIQGSRFDKTKNCTTLSRAFLGETDDFYFNYCKCMLVKNTPTTNSWAPLGHHYLDSCWGAVSFNCHCFCTIGADNSPGGKVNNVLVLIWK